MSINRRIRRTAAGLAVASSLLCTISPASAKTYKSQVKTARLGNVYTKTFIPKRSGEVPSVIISNGYTGTYKDYEPIARKLWKKGVAVTVFDFRGGSKQSKSDSNMNHMTVGTLKSDLRSVIAYAKKQKYTDKKRLYLAGHSQGGLVTSLVANNRKDIAGLFLIAPAYNIPTLLKYYPGDDPLEIGSGIMGTKYIRGMKNVQIYNDIKNYKGPVYIFQGKDDTTVDPLYAEEASKEYRHAKLFEYEGQGHVFDQNGINRMCRKVLSVVKKK